MLSSFIGFFLAASCVAVADPKLYNSKVVFCHGSTNDSYDLLQAEKIFDDSRFDKSRRTVLYLHGFQDRTDIGPIKLLVKAYRRTNTFNILLFDWRELANWPLPSYPVVIFKLEQLGEALAKFIIKMTFKGYDTNKWHLVGHSLGAHIAGYTGKKIQTLSNGTLMLPRISGLDPAGPLFYPFPILFGPQPISKTDAKFVDVIHTDAGGLGASINTGTVDFWPNGGHPPQPGCCAGCIIGCSHMRAIYLWIESVEDAGENSFISQNRQARNIEIRMGLDCPTDTPPGEYDVVTNDSPPYTRS